MVVLGLPTVTEMGSDFSEIGSMSRLNVSLSSDNESENIVTLNEALVSPV